MIDITEPVRELIEKFEESVEPHIAMVVERVTRRKQRFAERFERKLADCQEEAKSKKEPNFMSVDSQGAGEPSDHS